MFYIAALFIIVAIPAYFRCSPQLNQVGIQEITSVSDCDNLLLVTCKNSCGRMYGEYNTGALSYSGTSYYSAQGAVLYTVNDNYCTTNGQSVFGEYSFSASRIGSADDLTLLPTTLVFFSQQECMENCNLVGIRGPWYIGSYPYDIGVVDCSCTKVPECSCDSANTETAVEFAVTDAETCKKSYAGFLDVTRPTPYALPITPGSKYACPLVECVGVLNELLVCDSAVSTIGVIGGYLSILYSFLSVLFAFILSWKSEHECVCSHDEYNNELELEKVA